MNETFGLGARTRRVKTCKSLGQALRSVAGTYRRRIKLAYRSRFAITRLDDERRAWLSECIFAEENELEHRHVHGGPKPPQVKAMRDVRNRLYDDMGWNEYQR